MIFAPDPSGGWLSYAVFEADPTDTITKLSATMTVPDAPKHRGAEPAFWFGVQTHKGDGALVQPIQAKWLGGRWDMFHEIFGTPALQHSSLIFHVDRLPRLPRSCPAVLSVLPDRRTCPRRLGHAPGLGELALSGARR